MGKRSEHPAIGLGHIRVKERPVMIAAKTCGFLDKKEMNIRSPLRKGECCQASRQTATGNNQLGALESRQMLEISIAATSTCRYRRLQ
jgi:hypothetical protein